MEKNAEWKGPDLQRMSSEYVAIPVAIIGH